MANLGVEDTGPELLPDVEAALQFALARAIEEDQKDTLVDPLSSYPAPIVLGATAYRDCAIWSADWRKRLPLDHSSRLTNPADFVEHDDPEYRATLGLMVRLGISTEDSVRACKPY